MSFGGGKHRMKTSVTNSKESKNSAGSNSSPSPFQTDKETLESIRVAEKDLTIRFSKRPNEVAPRLLIVSVNVWCETFQNAYPAEIGLVEVALQEGVTNRYSQLLKIQEIPVGFKENIMKRIENIHQISMDNEHLTSNYTHVFKAITNIATAGPNEFYAGQNFNSDVETPQELRSSRKYRLLPLCVMPEERGSIKKVFQWLASLENSDIEFAFFNLDFVLSKYVKMSPQSHLYSPEPSVSHNFLRKEICTFSENIACEYHETVASPGCACARATRYALIFCDIGFQAYGLTHNRQLVSDKFDLAHAKSAPEENGQSSTVDICTETGHPMKDFSHIVGVL